MSPSTPESHATVTTAEKDRLAREHISLAYWIARRNTYGYDDPDDITSDALTGLARAIDTWTPARGVAFAAWAARKIRWSIKDGRRQRDHLSRPQRWRVAAGSRVTAHDQPPVSLEAIVPGAYDATYADGLIGHAQDEDERLVIAAAIRELPARERFVLLASDQWGLKLREIGRLLGVTESRASQIRAQAVKRLRVACDMPKVA